MSATKKQSGPSLDRIRGSLTAARPNARTVAALTGNPGCRRRRIVEASAIQAHELAAALGHPVTRGQSPFAIATGNHFERRLKGKSKYELLVKALRPFVALPDKPVTVDLGHIKGVQLGAASLRARARETEKVLATMLKGGKGVPDIADHPVLEFDLAGTTVFLEPDALALRSDKGLEVVEIKSYAVIDDQADPEKLSSTGGQVAVYILALRAALERGGADPDVVPWSFILVTPRNFGRDPVAHRIPAKKKAMALQRVLKAVPRTGDLLAGLHPDFTLDVAGNGTLEKLGKRERVALQSALQSLRPNFVPECLASCDLARACRHEAIEADSPCRLGRSARDIVAGVPTLGDALAIARDPARPVKPEVADVAEALRSTYAALQRARARAPEECALEPAVRAKRK